MNASATSRFVFLYFSSCASWAEDARGNKAKVSLKGNESGTDSEGWQADDAKGKESEGEERGTGHKGWREDSAKVDWQEDDAKGKEASGSLPLEGGERSTDSRGLRQYDVKGREGNESRSYSKSSSCSSIDSSMSKSKSSLTGGSSSKSSFLSFPSLTGSLTLNWVTRSGYSVGNNLARNPFWSLFRFDVVANPSK